MRVWHSSGDVKSELLVIIDLIVTDFDAEVLSYLNGRLAQNVIENWINCLSDINEENLETISDTMPDLFDVLWILGISNDQSFLEGVLDPLHGLSLWIDVQSPTETLGDEATILG